MVELHTIAPAISGGTVQPRERTNENLAHHVSELATPRRSSVRAHRVMRIATEAPTALATEAAVANEETRADEAVALSEVSGGGEGVATAGGIAGAGSASAKKCCGDGLGGDGSTASQPPRMPARPVYNPRPVYPRQARLMGWEGSVVLRVLVDTQGNAADVTVVSASGQGVLDQSAVDAVRRWRFAPATEAGKPVTMVHDVRIRFRLDDYPA